jgi:futalosine hydrolase
MSRILVVTAATAERDAVVAGRSPAIGMVDGIEVHRAVTGAGMIDTIAGGVGSAAAAVATGCVVRHGYDLVVSAGIAGGFPAAEVGSVIVAHAVVHADLGAQTPSGFASMADLGWGPVRFELDSALTATLAHRTGGVVGSILSVSTVTGTQARAEELRTAHPDAVGEAMEGVGSYLASARAGVPFAEVRTVSNRVGPRDRDAWRVGEALAALTLAFDRLLDNPLELASAGDRIDRHA